MSTNSIQNEKGLQIFESPEFGQVRMVEVEGKPYFYATDVAKALGYSKPHDAITRHCRYSVKHGVGVQTGLKANGTPAMQTVQVNVIPEGDIYRLVTHSKLPSAERFEHWVFEEVLPSIRKHGMYMTKEVAHEAVENPKVFLSRALLYAQKTIDAMEIQLEEVKPKVLLADSIIASETSIPVGDMAKILRQHGIEIGQNRLYEWLRENEYLMKFGKSKNMPTQKAMNLELFEIEEKTYYYGTFARINKITRVTGKGQLYFVNLFRRKSA